MEGSIKFVVRETEAGALSDLTKRMVAIGGEKRINVGIRILEEGGKAADEEIGLVEWRGSMPNHFFRTASHVIFKEAADFGDAVYFVGVKPGTNGNAPKEAIESLLRHLLTWKINDKLVYIAPWGEIPRDPESMNGGENENLILYRDWMIHAGVDKVEDCKGHFKVIVPKEIRTILKMNLGKESKFNSGFMSTYCDLVRDGADPLDLEQFFRSISSWFVEFTKNQLVQVEPSQIPNLVSSLWKAKQGDIIDFIIPTCPAWEYNSKGYSFNSLLEADSGIMYKNMVLQLEYAIESLGKIGIKPRILIALGDVEYLDFSSEHGEYGACEAISRDEFMRRIANQKALIISDLKKRGIEADVKGIFETVTEEEFIEVRRMREETDSEKIDNYVGKVIFNLNGEKEFYLKQAGGVLSAAKMAARADTSLVLSLVDLVAGSYSGRNLLWFVQVDSFLPLYKDYPIIGWKYPKGGLW